MRPAHTATATNTTTTHAATTTSTTTTTVQRPAAQGDGLAASQPEASPGARAPHVRSVPPQPTALASASVAQAAQPRSAVCIHLPAAGVQGAPSTGLLPQDEFVVAQQHASGLFALLDAQERHLATSRAVPSATQLRSFFDPIFESLAQLDVRLRSDLAGEAFYRMWRIARRAHPQDLVSTLEFCTRVIRLDADPVLPWRVVHAAFADLGADARARKAVARLSLRIDPRLQDHRFYPFAPELQALRQALLQGDPSATACPLQLRATTFDSPSHRARVLVNHIYGELRAKGFDDDPRFDVAQTCLLCAFDDVRAMDAGDPDRPQLLRDLGTLCTDALAHWPLPSPAALVMLEWVMPQLDATWRKDLLEEQLSGVASCLELDGLRVPSYPQDDPDRLLLYWVGANVHLADAGDQDRLLRWFATHVHRAGAAHKPILLQRLVQLTCEAALDRAVRVRTLCTMAAHAGETALECSLQAYAAFDQTLAQMASRAHEGNAIHAHYRMPLVFSFHATDRPLTQRHPGLLFAALAQLPRDWDRKVSVIGMVRGFGELQPPLAWREVSDAWHRVHPAHAPTTADVAPWLQRRGAAPGRVRFVDFWFTPLPARCLGTFWVASPEVAPIEDSILQGVRPQSSAERSDDDAGSASGESTTEESDDEDMPGLEPA